LSERALVITDQSWKIGLKICQVFMFLPRDASAERGNATVSRPSVCLSVRDV